MKNFLFAYEVAFTYMLSIYLFRAAVRRNNAPLILATRVKFAPLFFAMNQTNYQELHIRDCLMRVNMPDEIHKLVTNNESFSCSGHQSKGEGGDFILEAKNRRTKMWMPPGTPTEKRWYRVCRNQDRLEKMKDDLSQMLGMVQSDDLYHYDLTEEIFQFRRKIRSFGVFNDPLEQRPLTCLNGHYVDHDLINFSVHAKENLEKYLEVYESDSTFGKGPVKLQPVFVLPTDRDTFFDITKKSKSTLEKEIKNALEKIETTQEGIVLKTQWTSQIKKGTKNDYLEFYRELLQAVDHANFDIDEDSGEYCLSNDENDVTTAAASGI